MTQHTRFIPGEALGSVTHWQFPAMDILDAAAPAPLPQPTEAVEAVEAVEVVEAEPVTIVEDDVQALEALRQAAEEAGYARGLAAGLAQGVEQGRAQEAKAWQQRMEAYVQDQGQVAAQQLAQLVQSLESRLTDMQQQAAQEVLQLACDIARQVVRQEVHGNPHAVLPVVREALDMLAAEHQPTTVYLHPTDWAALETTLRSELGSSRVTWLADDSLAPGDCRVACAAASIDGSVERRWQRAIAALGLTSVWKDNHDSG